MANFVKLAITGLEHFHPNYGKLIGTGKNNGIQVFEQLVDGKKILTSVNKNGETVKQVARSVEERNMEKNLGDVIFNFFDRLTLKLNGVKLPKVEG